jgi:hypothetical protein
MAIDNKIPIVRALWGNQERTLSEVPPKTLFKNETVIVWGSNNKKYLEALGYNVKCLSIEDTDKKYSTLHKHYMHKLEAIKVAGVLHKEYIFLDWDCFPLRPFDSNFYNYLQKGNEVQIPIYAYPDKEGLGIIDMIDESTPWGPLQLTDNLKEYVKSHEDQLRKYSWKHNEMLVSPNFGFVYSRRSSLGKELIDIADSNNVLNCIEEHSFYIWANCTLDEYINKYEPKVLQGTSDDVRIYNKDSKQDAVIKINKYVNAIAKKDIYLKHI